MKKPAAIALCVLLLAAAAVLTVYPLISNRLADKYHSDVLSQYDEAVAGAEDDEIAAQWEAAASYNETLSAGAVLMDSLLDFESTADDAEEYNSLLNPGGDGIMGYIEIPKIDVYLPIYHGTEADALDNGVGHLFGTSLPVGGAGTHCVLAAHSGLSSQRLFSDLDQLQEGDSFYLHVLGQTLAYTVEETHIVTPDDTSSLIITPGEDRVTLVTCTPYGVNTHRLLVQGVRAPYEEASEETTNDMSEEGTAAPSTWRREYMKGLLLGAVLFVAVAGGWIVIRSYTTHGKHEKRRLERD